MFCKLFGPVKVLQFHQRSYLVLACVVLPQKNVACTRRFFSSKWWIFSSHQLKSGHYKNFNINRMLILPYFLLKVFSFHCISQLQAYSQRFLILSSLVCDLSKASPPMDAKQPGSQHNKMEHLCKGLYELYKKKNPAAIIKRHGID